MIKVDIEKHLHLETEVILQKTDIHVALLTAVPSRFTSQHRLHSGRSYIKAISAVPLQREEECLGADRSHSLFSSNQPYS